MRILYVVSRPIEINTSASIRNRATIDGLIELGHSVEVVTTEADQNHMSYDSSLLNGEVTVRYLKSGSVQEFAKMGRRYRHLKPLKNAVHRFMSHTEVYDNLKGIIYHIDDLDFKEEDYDLIISSSDPKSSHLFVNRMFQKGIAQKTPWIQIWGDPFLADITRKNKRLSKKIEQEERRLLEKVTKIVYVSELTLQGQKKLFPEYAGKMFYAPIPYAAEELYPETDLSKDSLTFLYCGDYTSSTRNIFPLYEAITQTDHKLIICGHSDVGLENTEKIEVHSRISFGDMKKLESECDVLVHLSNLSGNQIPGKIYQYSGTNKPILFLLDGDSSLIKNIFKKHNRYIFSENEKENITKKVGAIATDPAAEYSRPIFDYSPAEVARQILT